MYLVVKFVKLIWDGYFVAVQRWGGSNSGVLFWHPLLATVIPADIL